MARSAPAARHLVRTVGVPVAAALTSYVCASAVAGGSPAVLLAVAVALGGALALRNPLGGVVALLLLTSTIFWERVGAVTVGGIRSDLAELLAFGLIASWAVRTLLTRRGTTNPYAGFVVALLLALGVGTAVAFVRGVDTSALLGALKAFALYLLVLPIVDLFAAPRGRERLERIVVGLATATSIVVLVAVASGVGLQGRPGTNIDPNDVAQALRVRPPVMPLLFLASMLVFARVVRDGLTAASAAALALFACVWLVTFNRSTWVALVLAAVVVVRWRRRPLRPLRVGTVGLVLVVIFPLTLATAASGVLGPVAQAGAGRLMTTVSSETYRSKSYDDRASEWSDARRALARSPVFGVGLARSYGATRHVWDPRLRRMVEIERPFVHNSWVHLYLQLGLAGLAAFAVLVVTVARQRRARAGDADDADELRSSAACAMLFGLGVEALANPNLTSRPHVVALALALALASGQRASSDPDGQPRPATRRTARPAYVRASPASAART